MKRLQKWVVFSNILFFAFGFGACGDSSGKSNDDPDSGVIGDAGEDSDGGETGLPVGSECTANPECSGPDPVCLQEDIAPLSSFENSSNEAAQELAQTVVIPMPDTYCSNTAPCTSDADCGDGGRCFLPLIDVDETEYADLVGGLNLPTEEEETLVGFHEYGQCLKPCEGNGDCTRPGYHCAIPLENFLTLVESMGARMETYCIGEPEDPCDPNPCDHGTCSDNGDGTFTCDCESGWIGDLCDTDDPCDPNPCLHNGTCSIVGGNAECSNCDPGWSGTLCDVPHDCGAPPAVNPPLNVDSSGGTLLGDTITYSCDSGYDLVGNAIRTCTASGWSDSEPTCELEPITCGPNTCNGHGTCVEQGGVFDHCECDDGWTGDTCGTEVDCGAPDPAPADGSIDYTTTTYGSTATYSCNAGYSLVGTASVTCQNDGTWSDVAPVCDPVDCGNPDPAPANGSVSYTSTTYGSAATYDCNAGYGLVGNATTTCQSNGTWSNAAPTCELQYCDVLYQVSGTFRVSDAPNSCGDVSNTMTTNNSVPSLDNNETTPFNTTDFQDSFIRLRFPENGGAPTDGSVSLIEYYLPVEFLVDCPGTNVTTDVDHSVGILEMSGDPPQVQPSPNVSRTCQPWATGQLSGTSLDWSLCDVIPPGSGTWWSHDDAQAGAGDTTTACAMRMSVWGNVSCSGWFCGLVPNLGNQLATWDQLLNNFVFSGSDYTTATFSMSEVQIPESTSEDNTRTWVTFNSATPIHVECGAEAQLTCDEIAP